MAHVVEPWEIATLNESYAVSTPEDENGQRTCVCVIAGSQCPGSLSAARLIAAAPEMLAAMKQAVTALNVARRFKVGETDSYQIASACDAAIAKAEGRE
jgi:hypothetical protein